MNSTRQSYIASVRSLVVKLGTQLLSDSQGRLDTAFIEEIANQVVALHVRGIFVTIVSSGAIGAGLRELNLSTRPLNLAMLQAVAAVGQRRLMDAWAAAFSRHNRPVAQILLTREDVDNRARFTNLRSTIQAIHDLKAVPIVNENDTVSTDELVRISFGDNDILAALVTQSLRADLLILLSVVDGLLDAQGQPVRLVHSIEEAQQLVRAEKSTLGKGGMNSKLEAARLVTTAGEGLIVANGRAENILPRLLDSEEAGTFFVPGPRRRPSRVRWIGAARAVGAVVVDAGAVAALVEKKRSLLPAGVVKVEGSFEQGDLVDVKNPEGQVIARGLSNYSAETVNVIRGKKTADVRAALGATAFEEVIHRDYLVVG